MIETFKKGQLVPRRVHLAMPSDRKAQHCVVFGCDAQVEGRRVTALSDGPIFYVRPMVRRMNNGTLKQVNLCIQNVHMFTWRGAACTPQPADQQADQS